MWYDVGKILNKYKSKAKSKRSRKIGWKITQDEFLEVFRRNGGLCDYTNEPMSIIDGYADSVTVERIDPLKPYEFGNICLVRSDANNMKNNYLDCADSDKQLAPERREDVKRFTKVCEVLFDPEQLNDLKTKYMSVHETGEEVVEEEKSVELEVVEQELPVPPQVKENKKATPFFCWKDGFMHKGNELVLTRAYYEYGTYVQDLGAEFNLKFSEFKTKILAKKCALTGREFDRRDAKVLWIKDKSLPITRNNVYVTTYKVSEALDRFITDAKLTTNELKQLLKVVL